MKRRNMIIAVLLAANTLTAGMPLTTVMADETDVVSTENPSEVTTKLRAVVGETPDDYTVTAPKKITLAKNDDTDEYSSDFIVNVSGFVNDNETISVTPKSETIALQRSGREDIPASVSLTSNNIEQNDASGDGYDINGKITASNVPAGTWTGNLELVVDCEKELAPGLYDANNQLVVSYEDSGLNVRQNYNSSSTSSTMYYKTNQYSAYSVCQKYPTVTKIVIPDSVTSIGEYAFYDCSNLTTIKLPETLTKIDYWAFSKCTNLKSIKIPSNTVSINKCLFSFCSNLESVVVDENNQVYDSRDNCNAIIDTANNELVVGCKSSTIPNGITSIGGSAFKECYSLKSITIPDSVTTIKDYAFERTGLTSIDIPSGVTKYGSTPFGYITSLTSANVHSSIMATSMFSGDTNLSDVTLSDDISVITDHAFDSCKVLTSIELPSSLTKLNTYSFYQCNLASVKYKGATFTKRSDLESVLTTNKVEYPSTTFGLANFK